MATIKDALDIIGKLTTKDRERLRTMLLSTVSVKSADMESFLTDERYISSRMYLLSIWTTILHGTT